METFRAFRLHTIDDIIEGRLESLALDDIDGGDVLIRTAYSAVNYKDAMAAHGIGRNVRADPPCIGGIEMCGVVVESDDPAFAAGDKVMVASGGLGVAHGLVHGGALSAADALAASSSNAWIKCWIGEQWQFQKACQQEMRKYCGCCCRLQRSKQPTPRFPAPTLGSRSPLEHMRRTLRTGRHTPSPMIGSLTALCSSSGATSMPTAPRTTAFHAP